MGFIEDERRRKAEEVAQRESQLAWEQQKKERDLSRIRSAYAAEQEIIAQRQKAKEQLEQSGLGGMIRELGNIGSHKKAKFSRPEVPSDMPGSHHVVDITVGKKWPGDGRGGWQDKKVMVDVAPDGTIKIKGGLFGSTTLSKEKWQGKGGSEALEKALGKAYNHPKLTPSPDSGGFERSSER